MESSEIIKLATETAKVSNTGVQLLDRVFSPWNAKRSADAKAQNTVQSALAQRLSDLIEGDQLTPDAYDILVTCGGKMSVVNLANFLSKALPMLDEGTDPSLISQERHCNGCRSVFLLRVLEVDHIIPAEAARTTSRTCRCHAPAAIG